GDQGMRVIEAHSHRKAAMILHDHLGPGLQAVLDRFDFVAEDPGMPRSEPAFLILRKSNDRHGRLSDTCLGGACAEAHRERVLDSRSSCWRASRRKNRRPAGPVWDIARRWRTRRPAVSRIRPAGA